MNENGKGSKMKNIFRNKNTVIIICMVLIVLVLVIGYNIRVRQATQPVSIPVAKVTIQPRTEITADMITVIKVPKDSLGGNYFTNSDEIKGKYANVNTVIPEGSIFYREAVITKEELPDSSLYEVPEGETLFYLTVNMLTSYTNSILPGNYVDIYISTRENDKALVGKLLTNVKILAVKTSDGKNVFENSEESRVPYVILFSLPEEQHLLLRDVNAINNYSIYSASAGSRIEIIPVPTTANFGNSDQQITSNVTSQYLKDYILNMAATIPEDIPDIDFGPTGGQQGDDTQQGENVTE